MSCTDSAVDLLMRGNEDRIEPTLNRYWSPVLGLAFGLGTGCTINLFTRRPALSGLQKHILASVIWTAGLTYFGQRRNEYFAEKDAVLRHYVQLHPEDFPAPERKKIGELFEAWIPVR